MGKREEYRSDPYFEKIEKILTNLAKFAHYDKVPKEFYRENRVYRLLTHPIDELDLWEVHEGYDPKYSVWKRFVCTANRYLGCMMKKGLAPPWLHKPQVMIELHELYPPCVKYSEAALGKFPVISGRRMDDMYVSQEDLPLFECWTEEKIDINRIKKIYLDEEADEKVKKRVMDFAKKYNIPVENRIPCPSDNEEDKAREWGITNESLEELIDFLKNRRDVCTSSLQKLPMDPVTAALTESFDEAFHESYRPLGSSDAISVRNERLRENPLAGLIPPPECDKIIKPRLKKF